MPPDLVIFDCDGVIVDSEPLTNAVLADQLRPYGLDLSPEEAASRFVGGTMAQTAERVRALGHDLPEDWVDGIYAAMFERLRQGTPLIEGVVEVFDRLDVAGIPCCIASNGPMAKMEITLGQNGLLERFQGRIFSAHDVGPENAKPNPGLFLIAAETMGFGPGGSLVIEDTATGARAAKAAGMVCFGHAADTPVEKLTAEGATPFFAMADLPELLGI